MERVRKEIKGEKKTLLQEMEEALEIDGSDLDTGLLQQPQLYWQAAEQVAISISLRDEAATELTLATARADHQIRKLAKARDESTTEPDIKARIALDIDVGKASKRLAELKLLTSKWQAMESSFEQRMKALQRLADLQMKNYFMDSGRTSAQNSMKSHNADLARRDMAEQRRRRSDS